MLVLGVCFVTNASGQYLSIQITGIRNTKGVLQLAIFENQEQFEKESPASKYLYEKSSILGDSANINISLDPGIYGIAVLDDEDRSGNMSYKLRIYPKEGVGFSNHRLKGLNKPKFSDFYFMIKDGNNYVIIDMRYF